MGKKSDKDEEEMVIVGPLAGEDLDGEEGQISDSDSDDEHEDEDEGEEDSDSTKKSRKKKASSKNEDEEDGDSDEDDERVGHGEDDEEDDEDGKPKKRESRKARRERQRKARQRSELELNFLRQQNENLERQVREINQRLSKTEVGSIDSRIQQIQSQLKVADQVLARAHEDGDGNDVVEATNIRDKLKESLGRLNEYKTVMSRRQQEEDPPVDSRLIRHARAWMSDHDWYNPEGTDKDSKAVAAIDNRLVAEGYDPSTPEYWEELTDRVRRRLPHRFDDGREEDEDEDEKPRRGEKKGGGPKFSTGGRERPLRKNEVYISPDRKKAMEEAGVWDDPVLRQRYLKRYAQYDRENRRGQR